VEENPCDFREIFGDSGLEMRKALNLLEKISRLDEEGSREFTVDDDDIEGLGNS